MLIFAGEGVRFCFQKKFGKSRKLKNIITFL